MSCFGMANGSSAGWPLSPSPSRSSSSRRRRRSGVKPWRLWWRRCAGVAAVIHSKIRRRAVRWPGGQSGRRRREATASMREREGWCHHRSFAPVYVDELYSHPRTHHVAVHEAQQPNTTAAKTADGRANNASSAATNATNNASATFSAKNAAADAATNASATFAAKNAAADAATNAGARGKGREGGGKKAAAAAATNNGGGKARGGVRSLLMSPLRGGGACGMGEVDVRAEVFIRKFREEMRLQNQKSAEEFHAMLARGL
uniref:Uncharacterized protein n=1 Tax=Oryza punctata TaxID=4537 RepID=A0A0E0LQV3_ORYPU